MSDIHLACFYKKKKVNTNWSTEEVMILKTHGPFLCLHTPTMFSMFDKENMSTVPAAWGYF